MTDRRLRPFAGPALVGVALLVVACGAEKTATPPTVVKEDGVDLPLRTATTEQRQAFRNGDAAFGLAFRAADGLGPLFIRTNCEACHAQGARGPGLVQKMAIVGADGLPAADQSALPFGHTARPFFTADGMAPLVPPESGWGAGQSLKVTSRLPPAILGRGYIEAILDSEIERVEHEQSQRVDAIHGRINRVTFRSTMSADLAFNSFTEGQTGLIGRFGLKARQPSLDDFTADAFQGDMGMTSPLRPTELANPDGLADDDKPGLDVDLDKINLVANYMRLVEIPRRDPAFASEKARGAFDRALCSACHVPTLRTASSYPIPQLAGIDAPIYSDLLLHDLGGGYSDGLTDESATASEWKTAPLIGLRFMKTFLHDGRAHSVEEAIVGHAGAGSQASESVQRFQALSPDDRSALVAFVESL